MYTLPETYEDYVKWYYVFIMSNSPRFRENMLKAAQNMRKTCAKAAQSCSLLKNLRKPANNPEQVCAAFSG